MKHKMKQLNTLKEVFIALGNGKTVINGAGGVITSEGNSIYENYRGSDHEIDINYLEYPCTIKEEPKYLWEVAQFASDGKWVLSQVLQDKVRNGFVKTGRKFLEEGGKLVEVKQ